MNCDRFHDQLADLVTGRAHDDEVRPLLEHASVCEECASVLAFEEVLQMDREQGDASRVPEELASTMWERVSAALKPAESSASSSRRRARVGPRASDLGLLAWASVAAVLILGLGFELGRRAATPAAIEPRPWESAVPANVVPPGQTGLTAGQLLEALRTSAPSTTLLDAEQAQDLLRRSRPLRRWLQGGPAAIVFTDGIQTRELQALLRSLPPDLTLPALEGPHSETLRRWLDRRV